MESAELESRIAEALEKAAVARRNSWTTPQVPQAHEFQNTVDIAGFSDDDAMRELRYARATPQVGRRTQRAVSARFQRRRHQTHHEDLEVLACLAKVFGIPYEEGMLFAAHVQCPRSAHSSGREYLRALTTAQRNMQRRASCSL